MKKILFVLSVLVSLAAMSCSNPSGGNNPIYIPPVVPTEPETPTTVEPESPVPAQPETPAQPEQPQTPVTTEPETPTTVEPETPVTTEPETPVTTQPETPTTAEPETPAQPEQPQVQEDKSPFEYVKPDCVNLNDYTYVGDYIFADTMNFAEWKYSNAETGYTLAFEKIARVKNDNPNTQISRCSHDTGVDSPVIKATKYKIYVKTSVVDNTEENRFVLNVANKGLNENYDGSNIRIKKLSGNELQFTVAGDGNISDYITF